MYATTDQLYAYLDQVTETVPTTALLTDILTRATAVVKSTLAALVGDPLFDLAAYGAASTKIVTAYGGYVLALPPYEAGSATLVEYEESSNPTVWTAITDEWYEQLDGTLYRPYGWGWQYHPATMRYRITATWGYGPVPADIESVTLDLAVNTWRSKDKGGFTEIVGADGAGAVRVVAGLTAQHRSILEAHAATLRGVAV